MKKEITMDDILSFDFENDENTKKIKQDALDRYDERMKFKEKIKQTNVNESFLEPDKEDNKIC